MRVNIDVALDAFLSHVGPGVPAHPLPLAFRAFVFTETALLPLIRGQAFTFGSSLERDSEQTVAALPTSRVTQSEPLKLQQLSKHFWLLPLTTLTWRRLTDLLGLFGRKQILISL